MLRVSPEKVELVGCPLCVISVFLNTRCVCLFVRSGVSYKNPLSTGIMKCVMASDLIPVLNAF
jgi:hypothetical protein